MRRELPRVPYSVPVLVIGNFRDAAAGENEGRREVLESDTRAFIQRANKARQAALSAVAPSDDSDLLDLRNISRYVKMHYLFSFSREKRNNFTFPQVCANTLL